jgi:hypothetical protein
VAFIAAAGAASAHSRAYLLSYEQYAHLVCGENNVLSLPPLPLAEAISKGSAIISGTAGRYDQLVYLGHRGGYPVLTTTTSQPKELNAPAPAYLLQVIVGLRQLRHSPSDIMTYLADKPGIQGCYSTSQLKAMVRDSAESEHLSGAFALADNI